MRKQSFIYVVLTILCFSLHSEAQDLESLAKKYDAYFNLNPETFYTHINKDKYFKGESLWLKTYIYDTRSLMPYFASTNIKLSIFNSEGNLIDTKLFYGENATTFGHFLIDEKYEPGKYYLKTTTKWMKNFNEDRSHIIEFEVLNDLEKRKNIDSTIPLAYDFQILPEGGHALANAINIFGFKITNSLGKGVKIISGTVVDKNNNVITSFKSNAMGIGKFKFKIDTENAYQVNVTLENNETLSKSIDNIEPVGIVLSTENVVNNDYLIITLTTNKASIKALKNKSYNLILNRDGYLKVIDVYFKPNKLEYYIKFKKALMMPGINILTLINDNGKPISERLLFNLNNTKIKNLPKAEVFKERDSSIIQYFLEKNVMGNKGSLSVSILPNQTKAYDKKQSIISTFLLKPYIKGEIENPKLYFSNINRESLYNLDLLLMTQGWSKYSWKNIFYAPQFPLHDFEKGFSIKGKINNHKYHAKESVILVSKLNGIHLETNLYEDNSFKFEKLLLADSSRIQFSLKKNKLTQPNVFYILSPQYKKDSISIPGLKYKKHNDSSFTKENGLDFIYKSPIKLDTVLLAEEVHQKKPKNRLLQGSFGSKNFSLEDLNQRYSPGSFVTDVIKDNGFDVYNYGLSVRILSRRALSKMTPIAPAIYINDIIQMDFTDLATMRIQDVEQISVSQRGNMIGSAGAGGVIQIFTKTGSAANEKSKYNTQIVNYGFSAQKTYYSPLYDQSNREVFSSFGVIHWNPNIKSNAEGNIVFKIPNYLHGAINLYIEGMAEDGSLFSKIETITIE